MSSPVQRARAGVTGIVSMLVTGVWLVALFTGQGWWLPFMLFGYIVVVPVVAIRFGDEADIAEWVDDDVNTGTTDTDYCDSVRQCSQRIAVSCANTAQLRRRGGNESQ